MKTTRSFKMTFLIIIISSVSTFAQTRFGEVELNNNNVLNDETHPCISATEYENINKEINKNIALLGLDKIDYASKSSIALEWPLKPSANLNDCGYYYVSAYVDLNTATGSVQDWNCGARTYDGHRGVDIVSWPFIWDKMDNNLVEVIAAASGTIVAKVDGNPDRVCNGVGGGSNSNNYITILHSDGSQALYVHLKTGAMTSKIVGDTITTGEFLGIPGSAGQSTGQHLHFEIRSLGTFASYIDPNFGTCNSSIGASWWATQKPYTEPEIVKLSTHSYWPYFGVCPNTHDTTYYADSFISNPGAQANFNVFTKHVLTNDSWDFRILNPDNSVFDSWSFTSFSDRLTSNLAWNKTLPTLPGTYTFEGTFNGITCTTIFSIQTPVSINEMNNQLSFKLYPNPSSGNMFIEIDKDLSDKYEIQFFNSIGETVKNIKIQSQKEEIELGLSSGIYFYKVNSETDNLITTGKIIVE